MFDFPRMLVIWGALDREAEPTVTAFDLKGAKPVKHG